MSQLTPREREIVILLGEGLAPKEIAARLGVKPGTVRNQLLIARDKIGCTTTVQLAVKMARQQADT